MPSRKLFVWSQANAIDFREPITKAPSFLHSATELYAKLIDNGYEQQILDHEFASYLQLHRPALKQTPKAVQMKCEQVN